MSSSLTSELETFFWPVVNDALGKETAPGVDHEPQEESIQILGCIQPEYDETGKVKLPSQAESAKFLADAYRDQLAFHAQTKQFYRYEVEHTGLWQAEPIDFIQSLVQAELDAAELKHLYSAAYVRGVIDLLRGYVPVRNWNQRSGLLPLRNGVLDPATGTLLPHAPSYRLTWQLPYDYDPLATCAPIQEWMLEVMNGDAALVEVLRAFLNAIVLGRTDLQRFMECIGPGGTGKSTYSRLAIALVGLENTFSTELKHLENNRFETAGIMDKRLVLISDSDRYGGSVSTLKALTGEDTVRYEQKNQQQGQSFVPKAMVLICANEPIQSSDNTSGLQRRRLTLPFTYAVEPDARRNLINVTHSSVSGEFVPYISGLLNWVLAMPDERVNALVRDTERAVPSLGKYKTEALLQSNALSEWLDSRIVAKPGVRTQVGIAKKQRITKADPRDSYTTTAEDRYENADIWLYANYAEFVSPSGTKPVCLRRFSQQLEDLCRNQLKLEVRAGRDRNGSYVKGLAIRDRFDESASPLLVSLAAATTSLEGGNGKCDDKLLFCDVTVTAETLGSDGCDKCDGLFNPTRMGESENSKNHLSIYGKDSSEPITSVTSISGGTTSHHTSVMQSCFSVTGDGCAKHAAPATPEKQESSENSVDPWEGIE